MNGLGRRRAMMQSSKEEYVLTADMGIVESKVLEIIYNQGGCKYLDKATAKELQQFDGTITYDYLDYQYDNHDYSWVQYFTSKCDVVTIATYGNTGGFVIVGDHLHKGNNVGTFFNGTSGISLRRIINGNAIFLYDVPRPMGKDEYYFCMEWKNTNIYVPDEYYDNWTAELAKHLEGGVYYKTYTPLTGCVIRKLSDCPDELKSKIKIKY